MNITEEAFTKLYPEKEFLYEARIKYSGKFSGYNANVRISGKRLVFGLSRNWRGISKEIKIGLLQMLLMKIIMEKKRTTNTDLYNLFLKNVYISVAKTETNPVLEESFDRVNEKYFYGMIEKPNLRWSNSVQQLGSYEYGSDTITITKLIAKERREIIDYVMYHEMLHKKHKFKTSKSRSMHHTREFREKEREFENSKEIEKELAAIVRKNKLKRMFGFV